MPFGIRNREAVLYRQIGSWFLFPLKSFFFGKRNKSAKLIRVPRRGGVFAVVVFLRGFGKDEIPRQTSSATPFTKGEFTTDNSKSFRGFGKDKIPRRALPDTPFSKGE
jgi:hypothetical protein